LKIFYITLWGNNDKVIEVFIEEGSGALIGDIQNQFLKK
jgi:hypothetical protein